LPNKAPPPVFGEKDNGASVQVQRDAKITIELKENPTTGCM
jgi:predicted secreted protein